MQDSHIRTITILCLFVSFTISRVFCSDFIDTRISDDVFFRNEINLEHPGLEDVKEAAERKDYSLARNALAKYYKNRQIKTWLGDPRKLEMDDKARENAIEWGGNLLNHKVPTEYWTNDRAIDWMKSASDEAFFARMYWLNDFAYAYHASSNDPEIARMWASLIRGFIEQCPPPENGKSDVYWEGLAGGVRLRSGWPLTFHYMVHSESVTSDDIVVFIKSIVEHGRFLKANHWPAGNKLAFAMAGLHNSALMFPELTAAPQWRQYALEKAISDLSHGYLPDGMGVELSPGYHSLFSNYMNMIDTARGAGHGEDSLIRQLLDGCERLFMVYAWLSTPDRRLPRYQDGGEPDVRQQLTAAQSYYPENKLFQWFASDGANGLAPGFRSHAMPYAGYIAMRSGWETDAVYVGFDAGPAGFGHVHQDKLNLVLWAYGRMILMDPGHGDYNAGEFSDWARDTFAHNTALVDNRPQRRKWGKSGGFMPTAPLTDYTFQSFNNADAAGGIYDEAYGLPGPSSSYPYTKDREFHKGWSHPATHARRVFFLHPDIILVVDDLTPTDDETHEYEIRWHLNSVETEIEHMIIATCDEGAPNLMVAPLDTNGLSVTSVSAQKEQPILGWNFHRKNPEPAITVRHVKKAGNPVRFVTLLIPVRKNVRLSLMAVESIDDENLFFVLSDNRRFKVEMPVYPESIAVSMCE